MVLPGLMLALVLRLDMVKNGGKTRFFVSSMAGYAAGMITCMLCMTYFNAAQPALLYIVPGVLGTCTLHATAAGKLMELVRYTEVSDEEIQQKR